MFCLHEINKQLKKNNPVRLRQGAEIPVVSTFLKVAER
jgi:hypothetical protein